MPCDEGAPPPCIEEKFRFGIGGGDLPPVEEVRLGRLPLTEVGVLGTAFLGEPPGGDLRETGVVGPDPTPCAGDTWW